MMLDKIFAKPVEIEIGKQTLKFNSLADYEFSLSGRTSVPSKKINAMVKLSLDELKKENKTIKKIEKRFVKILADATEDTSSINQALREIDLQIFSQDHNWRMIINALHDGDEELNEFRRVALVKYMQYLSSRQEIIKHLYMEKKKYMRASNSLDEREDGELKGTLTTENLIRDSAEREKHDDVEMERMPKGENVIITLKLNEEAVIFLSKCKCKLLWSESGMQFIDPSGQAHTLKQGKNMVGRNSNSDIVIDPNIRDVSRVHLIIELDDTNTLYLTDLSSHGTSVPAKYFDSLT